MTKDNVIVFPTDRIKLTKIKLLLIKKKYKNNIRKSKQQQTTQYVEMSVDDIADLIKYFIDLQIK